MTASLFPDLKAPLRAVSPWPYEEVSERVVAARMTHGWTQDDLAFFSDLDLDTIRGIEQKKHIPRGDTLIMLCRALQVEPAWLAGLRGDKYHVEPLR